MHTMTHIINDINCGNHSQHRLVFGKKEIMSCMHRTGTPEDVMAGIFMDLCVAHHKAKEAKEQAVPQPAEGVVV
jgi:hypothetical protein